MKGAALAHYHQLYRSQCKIQPQKVLLTNTKKIKLLIYFHSIFIKNQFSLKKLSKKSRWRNKKTTFSWSRSPVHLWKSYSCFHFFDRIIIYIKTYEFLFKFSSKFCYHIIIIIFRWCECMRKRWEEQERFRKWNDLHKIKNISI